MANKVLVHDNGRDVNYQVITLSMPASLIEVVSRAARNRMTSRSSYIRDAILAKLNADGEADFLLFDEVNENEQ